MKKLITVAVCVAALLCLTLVPSHANDFKDNSLSFESQRLERAEEKTVEEPSDLAASLFLSQSTTQLEKMKEEQKKQAQSQLKQLFTKKSVKVDLNQTKELFIAAKSNQTRSGITVSKEEDTSSDILPTILYGILALVLLALVGFGTYRINKGEL